MVVASYRYTATRTDGMISVQLLRLLVVVVFYMSNCDGKVRGSTSPPPNNNNKTMTDDALVEKLSLFDWKFYLNIYSKLRTNGVQGPSRGSLLPIRLQGEPMD